MKRNFLILLCLILFIVSIAAVSATEDVNQTDNLELSMNSNSEDKVDLDNNNSLDENNDLSEKLESDSNILAMSKADKLTGREIVVEDFTFGDIQNAVDSAGDGDTVYLKAGTYLNNGNGPINIGTSKNNIFIVGVKDSTILDAQKTSGIFNIRAISGITIKDIVFINGKASYGGAIRVYNAIDNVNIDATFINNTASYGGANYFVGTVSNVNISGTYINNTANGIGGANYGGANYFVGTVSNVNISGTYINNTATHSGGANFFHNTVSNVNISGTYINNTASEYYGGANYFYDTVSNVNISGTYINNTALGYGGANYFYYTVSNVNISGTYINNTAKSDGGVNYFVGTVSDSYISGTYINNTAEGSGGVNYFDSVSNVNISGTYINNTADYGGANYFHSTVSDSDISGTYINNTAKIDGGANYFEGAVSNVNSSGTYINNTASKYYGGANYFNNAVSNVNISGTYINNTAYYGGGANYFNNAVSNVNSSGTYINNTAYYGGGANYFHSTVSDSDISGTYINNTAKIDGGANYFFNAVSKVNISGTYINNTAEHSGGANYFFYTVLNVNISGIYINNTADGTGLIYFFDNDNVGLNATISDAIFINNKCPNVINVRTNGVVAYNNWFGNNATNYKEKPKTHNVNMINWLFLNATADPSRIGVGNSSKIAFVLQSYNETSGIGFYDASKMNINLTLSQTLGELNKTSALISEKITYTAKNVGNATVTGKFETVSYTLSLTSKSPTNITVANSTVDLKVGDVVDLGATLTPADAGNLTYTSSNTSVAIVEKGKIKALANGTAVITVSFPGNENYTAAENKTINVTVNLKDAIISVNNSTLNLFVDDNFTVVTTTSPAGLKVTFVQDDSGVYIVDKNGNVTALKEGTGHILVKVTGNEGYAENSTTIAVTVSKIPTEITLTNATLDLKVDDEVKINATLTPGEAGELDFTSSDVSVVTVNSIGEVTAVGEGVANVTVRFIGNNKYAAAESNITVTVSLNDASVSVENSTLNLKFNDTFDIVPATSPKGLAVNYTSSNETVVTVDNKGRITAVGTGSAVITVSVGGDGVYVLNSTNIDVIVKKELNLNATTFAIIGNMTLIVSGFENATGNVSITVGEYNYAPSIMMGMVFVSLPKLNENVTAYIYYPGDGNYYNASTTVDIIAKKDLNLTIVADPIYVGENATVIVNGFENATGNVMVIAGMNFNNVTIINGTATTIIPGLNKTTTVTAFYMGDNNYNMNYTSVNITVLPKENLTISASAKQISVGEKATVIVTGLENATGNVTVHINNKTYSAPIVDGTAKVVIPDLTKNATAYVDYSGDRRYNPSNTTTEITVNKIKTTLTAKSITTTYNINKNLVITLEDANGNPIRGANITVDLNGEKTYTTDEKGQITVSTKGLAPKAYTAKVTFKGNEKYIDSNKNVDVTVKKATPKITAKAKTFKTTTKTKKYSIVLKNNVNKPIKKATVYLKVNGKTYKATTNSKGKATFKITKLNKAGKFKATVTYKGNKYYNKATKKVTIKVKSVWKTVSKGSKNSAIVKKIQRALKNNGYYLEYNGRYLMVDGIYWDYTEMAVKEFQNDKVLKVTGKVDEKTAKKLGIIK